MALVTVQRTPSPNRAAEELQQDEEVDEADPKSGHTPKSRRSQRSLKKLVNTVNTIRFVNRLRFSESYFTIKGAALILPKSDQVPVSRKRARSKSTSVQASNIQVHLQCMFHELRADDTIQVAIKLDSVTESSRYLAIVVTKGLNSQQEGAIIGFHCTDHSAQVGMVLPVYQNMEIKLDGDGGFRMLTAERPHIFRPVSIQAMWSAFMALSKVCSSAQTNCQKQDGPTHAWLSHYTDKLTADQIMINEWDVMDDLMSKRDDSPALMLDSDDSVSIESQIRTHLRELMSGLDLDEITSYMMRLKLEKILNRSLKAYRGFIDQELLLIIRQLDAASQVFDFVYLGSEWNASNLQELHSNGVGYILNVTREIDNFFPGLFKYMNIRLYDDEVSDLMRFWENTHRFICKARDNNSKVLVHCKMGVSRSASTVIAFAMKEYGWSLDETLELVRTKRAVIKPNDSFIQQLRTYEGILNASKQRWNPKWMERDGAVSVDRRSPTDKTDSMDQLAPMDTTEHLSEDNSSNTKTGSTSKRLTRTHIHIKGLEHVDTADNSDNDSVHTLSECDSDSDSHTSCSTGSTVSYHLESDEETPKPLEEGHVVGLQYSKLNTDNETGHVVDNTQRAESKDQNMNTPEAEGYPEHVIMESSLETTTPCPSLSQKTPVETPDSPNLATSELQPDTTVRSDKHIRPDLTERSSTQRSSTGSSDDVSVCYGVVKKTKEQIAECLPSSDPTVTREEGQLPVTPGTVRKVLGKIECQSQQNANVVLRSSSFKKPKAVASQDLHRSSSVKGQAFRPPSLATVSHGGASADLETKPSEYLDTFAKIQAKRCSSEDKVTFSIGGDLPNASSSSEDLEKGDKLGPVKRSSCICVETEGPRAARECCDRSRCMLKIASKPMLGSYSDDEDGRGCSSPVPVKTLVGTFEDIGTTCQVMNGPLTIHIDSFGSDPFAHNPLSPKGEDNSSLQRSQSMQTMETKPSTSQDKLFHVRNVNTAAQKMQPCWRIKQDNTQKLMHSLSSAEVSSKDVM